MCIRDRIAFSLGNSRDIDFVACLESICFNDVSNIERVCVIQFELFEYSLVRDLRFVEMSFPGFYNQLLADVFKPELD